MLTFKEFLTESRLDDNIVDNPSFNELKGILSRSKYKSVKFIARGDHIDAASGGNIVHMEMLPAHVQDTMRGCDDPTPNYPHYRGEIFTGWQTGKLLGGLYSRGDKCQAIPAPDDHPIVKKMKAMGVKITSYYGGSSSVPESGT